MYGTLLAGVGLIVSSVTVSAETITVCASGCDYTSIIDAVSAASDGDVIQLSAETYHEGVAINPYGKSITIQGDVNPDGEPTSAIAAQGNHRVFEFNSGESAATAILSIRVIDGYSTGRGGGIYCLGSSPSFVNCHFQENNSDQGGGAISFNEGSNAVLQGCHFVGNRSSGEGGAIFNVASSPTFNGCVFRSNLARTFGGAVSNNSDCSPVFLDCQFIENSTDLTIGSTGGAVSGYYGGFTLMTRCEMVRNTSGFGGATYYRGSSLSIDDCKFEENSAVLGGGALYVRQDTYFVTGSTFAGNVSGESGGAITARDALLAIEQASLTNNVASVSGGGVHSLNPAPRMLSVADSLLCGNLPNQVDGSWQDEGGNELATECAPCPDEDADGVCDEVDKCPGIPDVDSDGDGLLDCLDACPFDPLKIEPGLCGCGVQDTMVQGDFNCDGIFDEADYYAMQSALGICAADLDGDGVVGGSDLGLLFVAWGACP